MTDPTIKKINTHSKYHGPPSRVDMYQKNLNRRGLGAYFVQECRYLESFFEMVNSHVPRGSSLLECGYGPGALGIFLSRHGYNVVCLDMDSDVIELGRNVNHRLEGEVQFQVCDLFDVDKKFAPDSFDAVISDVTLEHFSDDDILELLQKQLSVAKLNIFAVHCANILPEHIQGLDGGERLLKPSYWEALIKKAGGTVIDRFGYGFHYTRIGLLNWRIQELAEKLAERIFYKRLARFAAATGFVVKRGI